MTYRRGDQSNPGRRQSPSAGVRQMMRESGEAATRRMLDIMQDDSAWGAEGWLDQKVQVTLLNQAQDRAFGKAETLSVSHSHSHSGSIEHKKTEQPSRPSLKAVKLPEKGAVIEGKAVEVKQGS